jgi:hypothetical protein
MPDLFESAVTDTASFLIPIHRRHLRGRLIFLIGRGTKSGLVLALVSSAARRSVTDERGRLFCTTVVEQLFG